MTSTRLVALYELRYSPQEHKRTVTLNYSIANLSYNEVWDALDEVISHLVTDDYQLMGGNYA